MAPGEFTPAFVVFSRVFIGALVLVPLAAKRGVLKGALPYLKYIILYAIIELVGPWYFITNGEKQISSGLASLLIATVPFWSTLFASFLGDKSVWHHKRLLGMIAAFLGVTFIVGLESLNGKNSTFAIATILLSAAGYAIAPIAVMRKLPDIDGVAVNGLAMVFAAIVYLPFATMQFPTHTPSAKAIWSLLALGIFPTATAFVIFFIVMKDFGPTRTSMVAYVATAIAVLLGILLLDEKWTLGIKIGLPLVIIGSYFASRKESIP